MEEKKLNDEEIINCLYECGGNLRGCVGCKLKEFGNCDELILEAIKRLQSENATLKSELKKELDEHEEFTKKANAEIERLTEREKFLENAWHISLESANTLDIALDASRAREQEYKKQVDELKSELKGYDGITKRTAEILAENVAFKTGDLREKVVKEFAAQVKMAFYYEFDELIPSIMADKIDEIAKEITEGKK